MEFPLDFLYYLYNYYMVCVSQMVTYLVCDGWKYRFKVLMSRVRQATKDVVKSEV